MNRRNFLKMVSGSVVTVAALVACPATANVIKPFERDFSGLELGHILNQGLYNRAGEITSEWHLCHRILSQYGVKNVEAFIGPEPK